MPIKYDELMALKNLGQSGKEVQNERINVWPKLCDQERFLARAMLQEGKCQHGKPY